MSLSNVYIAFTSLCAFFLILTHSLQKHTIYLLYSLFILPLESLLISFSFIDLLPPIVPDLLLPHDTDLMSFEKSLGPLDSPLSYLLK